ncbi:Ig-like domain-containing protein [Rhizobium sp. 2MFCol3.1]|uniref:Ig-like domain-containing protein n=1 Tax=Rhizobium sp. 2MFCol3.1 TaxID=1246459 RepID=UPI0003823605|nr:Ig-like domain-containing protein [Rhizobium sp. 2MFCol3.1]
MKKIIGTVALLLLIAAAAMSVSSLSKLSKKEPQVASTFPLPGSVNVPGVRIQIGFSQPFDPGAMVLDVSARKPDGSKTDIAGSVEVNEQRTAAIFRSYRPLPEGDIQVRGSLQGKTMHDWAFSVLEKAPLDQGRGGPILLVLGEDAPFGSYLSEIMRAEGFTNFVTIGGSSLQSTALGEHRLVITAGTIPAASASALETWVNGGGHLISIRPSAELADLAGLRMTGAPFSEGELAIDTQQAPGRGLVADLRFHGPAQRYIAGPNTRTLATLSSHADKSPMPALTLRRVGNAGGEVAAFAFDLPQSVVLTRQGNPQWAGQERDGLAPIRPNDLFYGQSATDPQPDFIDISRVHIPQADEQMRLLTNLIEHLQSDGAPIPRFWYFPKRHKAVLVMAADDHGTERGTRDSFERMLSLDDKTCDVSKWECARATSWLYADSGLTAHAAKDYAAAGFDLGSHASTYCQNWSRASLDLAFAHDILRFRAAYPDVPVQEASRLHCIVWSDYSSQAKIGRDWGIRFDMNYYYWPRAWVDGRTGFMTGSGIPMRFSSEKGELINVYQQETHLVDEIFGNDRAAVEGLIQRALGPEQFFGAFGTHYDFHNEFDKMLMELARKYQVPMVSARQMLDWMDGRSRTDVLNQLWDGEGLSFTIVGDPRTHGMLTAMLPSSTDRGRLLELTHNGAPMPIETAVIKGVEYALFPGTDGTYRASYGNSVADNMAPDARPEQATP